MRTYIVAANARHADYWKHIHGISRNDPNYVYVSNPERLYGLSPQNSRFIFYETAHEHPQYYRIEEQIRIIESIRGIKPVVIATETENPMNRFREILDRFIKLEPARFYSLVTGIVGLLVILGVKIIPGLPDAILAVWIPLQVILQAVLIRPAVTANARVAVSVPDPINNPQVVEAGEAITTASNREIIAAAESSGPNA